MNRQPRKPNRPASIPAAAEYSNSSRRTMWRYIEQGILPAWRMGPKLVRVDLDDVDRLFQRIPTAASGK